MSVKRENTIIGGIVLVFSICIWFYINTMPAKAAMYPRFIVATLAVFALILLIQGIVMADNGKKSMLPQKEGLIKLGVFVGMVLVYALAIPRLGWVVSSSLFLGYFVKKHMGTKPLIFGLIVVCFVVARIIFAKFVYINMPVGVYGIW